MSSLGGEREGVAVGIYFLSLFNKANPSRAGIYIADMVAISIVVAEPIPLTAWLGERLAAVCGVTCSKSLFMVMSFSFSILFKSWI